MDWKALIGNVAPMLATALGGPLAGLAVDSIGKAMGMEAPTVQKVKDALTQGQLTGEQIAQLRQAETAMQVRMRELEIQEEQLYASDRDSARKREAAVKDSTPAVMAYLVTLGFFGVLGFLLWNGKPVVGGDALLVMLGSLGTAWVSIIGYYFGSSLGSSGKDSTIRQLTAAK